MPDRKSLVHLEKVGFDTRTGEVSEMLANYGNDKNKKEGGKLSSKELYYWDFSSVSFELF